MPLFASFSFFYWSFFFLIIGYYFGEAYDVISRYVDYGGYAAAIIAIIFILPTTTVYYKKRMKFLLMEYLGLKKKIRRFLSNNLMRRCYTGDRHSHLVRQRAAVFLETYQKRIRRGYIFRLHRPAILLTKWE